MIDLLVAVREAVVRCERRGCECEGDYGFDSGISGAMVHDLVPGVECIIPNALVGLVCCDVGYEVCDR